MDSSFTAAPDPCDLILAAFIPFLIILTAQVVQLILKF
jgi:hypothetical protein